MTQVALLLGGNLGSPEATFSQVRGHLKERVGKIVSTSNVLYSEPWGFQCQQTFANQALVVETALEPLDLLEVVQQIEAECGRCRQEEAQQKETSGERYCSRTIDIDIILYGSRVVENDRLTIPHLLMTKREFVLEPLAQIAPHLVHAKNGKSVEQMLNELKS